MAFKRIFDILYILSCFDCLWGAALESSLSWHYIPSQSLDEGASPDFKSSQPSTCLSFEVEKKTYWWLFHQIYRRDNIICNLLLVKKSELVLLLSCKEMVLRNIVRYQAISSMMMCSWTTIANFWLPSPYCIFAKAICLMKRGALYLQIASAGRWGNKSGRSVKKCKKAKKTLSNSTFKKHFHLLIIRICLFLNFICKSMKD